MTIRPPRGRAPIARAARTFALLVATAVPLSIARAESFTPPEILLLGDSQISFGAGEVLTGFFGALETECAAALTPMQRARVAGRRLGVLGARQTGLRAWTARGGKAKWNVCGKDPTWGVNASTFGVLRSERRGKYEQIGETPGTQFCAAGRTPFEEMFRPGYYAPELMVLWFLGNDAHRWAKAPDKAREDVERVAAQLPPDMPCVFMTTAPSYSARVNRLRRQAQESVLQAFEAEGRRCALVAGLTDETVSAMQGMARFYRRRDNGSVKDPYHPLRAGARTWLDLRKDAICHAVAEALDGAGGGEGDEDGAVASADEAGATPAEERSAPRDAPRRDLR